MLTLLPAVPSLAATLGPAETLDDLRAMLDEAAYGDVLLIGGDLLMDDGAPLTSHADVRITGDGSAVLRGLRFENASITFEGIDLEDSLHVQGNSHIFLGRGVRASGASGQPGVSFCGSGTLIIEPGCDISGGDGGTGVFISHTGGEFYGSIEGAVRGGSSSSGGTGVLISPLMDSSAVFISGSVQGGSGSALGGHGLNLYDLRGNAYVTVAGQIQGGSGSIGGDGIQLVSLNDTVSIGVSGRIRGGSGEHHGGNALILMNAEDSSSVNLSGTFSGGDASGASAQPGTSLLLVGESAAMRTHVGDCILEEGRALLSPLSPEQTAAPTPTPEVTPEPAPTPVALPEITPLPEITAPADNIAYIITPEPPRTESESTEDDSDAI